MTGERVGSLVDSEVRCAFGEEDVDTTHVLSCAVSGDTGGRSGGKRVNPQGS